MLYTTKMMHKLYSVRYSGNFTIMSNDCSQLCFYKYWDQHLTIYYNQLQGKAIRQTLKILS